MLAIPDTQLILFSRPVFIATFDTNNMTIDSLRAYFEQFGDIREVIIMRDKLSGRSRGFGFVSFVNKDAVDSATQQDHVLDGRNVSHITIGYATQAARFPREIWSDLNHLASFVSLSSELLTLFFCINFILSSLLIGLNADRSKESHSKRRNYG